MPVTLGLTLLGNGCAQTSTSQAAQAEQKEGAPVFADVESPGLRTNAYASAFTQDSSLPVAPPELVGLSSDALARLNSVLEESIDREQIPRFQLQVVRGAAN